MEELKHFVNQGLTFTQRTPQDKQELIIIANDPILRKNVGDTMPYPYMEEDADRRINIGSKISDTQIMRAIKIQDMLIGGAGLDRKKGRKEHLAHFGYRLGKPYRGQGYGSIVLETLIDIGFNHLKKYKLWSSVYSHNIASIKLIEKFGFKQEGILQDHVLREGELCDEIFYGMTKTVIQKSIKTNFSGTMIMDQLLCLIVGDMLVQILNESQ